MSFTSGTFIVFFAALLIIYWLLPRVSWQNVLLLAGSYLFYGWVHPWYAILLGVSTLADYGLTQLLVTKPTSRRTWLVLSILVNLGVLAFFKYSDFFASDLTQALASIGVEESAFALDFVLPAGLSFYTLKKLAYVLDVSRKTIQPTSNLIAFALFVSFLPQIVAGPIDRAQTLLPQIKTRREWKNTWFQAAWPLLVTGFFKKFVVADSLKVMVDRIYNIDEPSKLLVWSATLAFSVQILADFSAYTDLARAFAYLLGFETSVNFQNPYLSLTPTQFWNRWHITLSNWLRDYIFFPLRRALLKNKKTPGWLVMFLPPLITMFVSGLWHGAGWTFVMWGVLHGILIAVYQLAGMGGSWKPASYIKSGVAWIFMFNWLVLGWLFFRASSINWLGDLLLNAPWINGRSDLVVILITLAMTVAYSLPLIVLYFLERIHGKWEWLPAGFYALLLVTVIIYLNPTPPDFIYFQF